MSGENHSLGNYSIAKKSKFIDKDKLGVIFSLIAILISILSLILNLINYYNDLGFKEFNIRPSLSFSRVYSADDNSFKFLINSQGIGRAFIQRVVVSDDKMCSDTLKDPQWSASQFSFIDNASVRLDAELENRIPKDLGQIMNQKTSISRSDIAPGSILDASKELNFLTMSYSKNINDEIIRKYFDIDFDELIQESISGAINVMSISVTYCSLSQIYCETLVTGPKHVFDCK